MACHPCLAPFSFRSLFFQSHLFHKKSKSFGLKSGLNHWKKKFEDQIKKHKILHSSSIVTYEKVNIEALHNKNLTPSRIVLNNSAL
jgi:hypothetical protein